MTFKDDCVANHGLPRLVQVDSITQLGANSAGSVIVSGSHGGVYSANVALVWGVRAAIFHDAGVGLGNAGIAGLDVLQMFSVPGAAVLSKTALIGDVSGIVLNGIIGHVNDAARDLGCIEGMSILEAGEKMAYAGSARSIQPPSGESRTALLVGGPVAVWALDSASMVRPSDVDSIVVTGSHGQLLGRDPATALKVIPTGAVFNDAGVTVHGPAGRLGALGHRGIPAATVAAATARIGDGCSTYWDGVISRVNKPATAMGMGPGMRCRDFVETLIEHTARAHH